MEKKYTALFVDDEPQILSSLKRLLRKESFKVLTAESGPEGIAVLEEQDVQLIISDQRMPGMQGTDFLKRAKEIRPDAIRVILSGYADVAVIVEAINQGEIYRFFSKPWNDEELKTKFKQCLEHYELLMMNRQLVAETTEQNEKLAELNLQLTGLNRSLENLTKERTRALRMTQELLEVIPVPLVFLGTDDEIQQINFAARESSNLLKTVLPGTPLSDVLPEDFTMALFEAQKGMPDSKPRTFTWGEEKMECWAVPVISDDIPRGTIVGLSPLLPPLKFFFNQDDAFDSDTFIFSDIRSGYNE